MNALAEVASECAAHWQAALDRALESLAALPQSGGIGSGQERTDLGALLNEALGRDEGNGVTPSWLRTPWDWELLREEGELRVGVLTVFPRNPLPIHDHYQASGFLLVLAGSLTQRHYDPVGTANLAEQRAVTLALREERTLEPGDHVVFSSVQDKIHSLAAERRPATIFEMTLAPKDAGPAHWFLPIRPYRNDETELHALPFRRTPPGFS